MEENLKLNYLKAGEIATKVLEYGKANAKVGVKLLDLGNEIENKIIELGGEIAFPINLSRNEQAAHYTPSFQDETVIGEKDVLKIDAGVHIGGCICDCAFTIDFSGEYGKFVEASEAALEAALSLAKPGRNVREIGKAIQGEITKRGLVPIANLSGHRLDEFNLHAGQNIPNTESGNYVLQEGDVFAVEPFATNGAGEVIDGDEVQIFLYTGAPLRCRLPSTKKIGKLILQEYNELPFAQRWLQREMPDIGTFSVNAALRELQMLDVIMPYPILVEKKKGAIVSQSETSMIITEDGCIPLTSIKI
ncbi:MAG: type II methionyl aminopeptidase [Candidatus Micrarchaeota archaeon]